MNELIDKIDAYLDGTMNAEERAAFETQMNSNAALREQVDVQQHLRAGIDRLGMKAATASAFKKITLKNKLYKWGVATVAVAAVATTTYFAVNAASSNDNGANITYQLPATNENGGTEWADADRNLPTQLFSINPNKDTVIETMNGLVFAIPAGAFIDAKDPVTLEIREAITPMDIIKGGLSTTSNGELLETGGMFYFNARSGETSLRINPDKPVYANVPANEIRPDMQLFEGERKFDGSINWINPKPLDKKQLIPVDIFSLNFYPPGFLEKAAELGFDANNRKVTDSIYYSYAGRKNEQPAYYENEAVDRQDSLKIKYLLISYVGAVGAPKGISRTNTEAELLAQEAFSQTGSVDFDVLVRKYSDKEFSDEGKEIWITRNSRTHADMVETLLENGYWENYEFSTERGWYVVKNVTTSGNENFEIDPARIAAIRSEEFQNTIIATKEFEERLKVIFSICSPEILDMYVNHLDKTLYEIDSMVVSNFEAGGYFEKFKSRHDGGVSITPPHLKKLQEYYAKKQEAVRLAGQKTFENRTEEQQKKDREYYDQVRSKQITESTQYGQNLKKEYEINLSEAYRQLGIEPVKTPPAAAYYGVTVTTPGWKNVDAYVMEATVTRTTLDYTDPSSGKKAVIRYEQLDINIADAASYSQLMVYLVTDSLPCFMRVYPQNGAYREKLNELMEYSLVVMGEKDGTWFSATTPKVTPGAVNVTLTGTDEASLRVQMNSMFAGKIGNDLSAEISYMKETHAFTVRKEKEKQQAEIDRQIMQVIFPCVFSESLKADVIMAAH